jgi:Archaeal PaREP1/PaREP8 family
VTQERYVALNGKYLADADRLLAAGDYPQASEEYWGAAAEMVKSIGEAHSWRHSNHRDLRGAVSRLFRETGDGELLTMFSEAASLHATFNEDFMEPEDVRHYAGRIKALIQKLQAQLN